MVFRESKFGIGKGETGKIEKDFEIDEKEFKKITEEIERKYPEYIEDGKEAIEEAKEETRKMKEVYPDIIEELDQKAKESGFKGTLVSPSPELKKLMAGIIFGIYGLHYFFEKPEALPTLKELKSSAPEFFKKALAIRFGNKKEKIRGHETEHLRGEVLKLLPELIEKRAKAFKKLEEAKKAKIREMKKKKGKEAIKLAKAADRVDDQVERQVESQRVLTDSPSREEIIERVAEFIVFQHLQEEGLNKSLKMSIIENDKWRAWFMRTYSFLDREILREILKKEKEIKKELKGRYDKWKEGK